MQSDQIQFSSITANYFFYKLSSNPLLNVHVTISKKCHVKVQNFTQKTYAKTGLWHFLPQKITQQKILLNIFN